MVDSEIDFGPNCSVIHVFVLFSSVGLIEKGFLEQEERPIHQVHLSCKFGR